MCGHEEVEYVDFFSFRRLICITFAFMHFCISLDGRGQIDWALEGLSGCLNLPLIPRLRILDN